METAGNFKIRQPIVVILGHVDHGKTTLLDYIRKTNVAQKEEGGITQGIGASVIERKITDNQSKSTGKITFIDTPGHAAFASMRERGAKIADVAVLVIAANEGMKPQTKEALEYILSAKIPFIVAATKIDLSQVSLDLVHDSLSKQGILLEGEGGDVPLIAVSGRTGEGVDKLLDTIELVSELAEIKGDSKNPLLAGVIETGIEKGGPMTSVVIKDGKISVGDTLVSEIGECKVRGLFNQNKVGIKSAGPGEAVQILGFSSLPPVGSNIWSVGKVDPSLEIQRQKKSIVAGTKNTGISNDQKLNLIIKAKSSGSLEAVLGGISKDVFIVYSGVGDVSESDVFMAKASNALIFVFESKIPQASAKLAETEGVKIEYFDIIYRLFEKAEEIIKKGISEIFGTAEIIAAFPFNGRRVAGVKIVQGKITKNNQLVLTRGENKIGMVKIITIKKGKSDIEEAGQGEECGIFFAPQLDFKEGDMLISQQYGK